MAYKITSASFPKLLADLSHSNQFLKVFSLGTLAVLFCLATAIVFLVTKAPVVLTLSPMAEVFERRDLPKPEDEVRVAIKAYLEKRYKWEPSTVVQRLREAEIFVLPNAIRAYQAAAGNISRFSTEKLVSQKVFPEVIEVNLEKKTATIMGDRVTAVQGLKASGDLKLQLSFDSGPRTRSNPWGIYIVKELEEAR